MLIPSRTILQDARPRCVEVVVVAATLPRRVGLVEILDGVVGVVVVANAGDGDATAREGDALRVVVGAHADAVGGRREHFVAIERIDGTDRKLVACRRRGRERVGRRGGRPHFGIVLIDFIARERIARGGRGCPRECSRGECEAGRGGEVLAIDDGRDGCRTAVVVDADGRRDCEGTFDGRAQLVVEDAGGFDLTRTRRTALALDDEEVFQRAVRVKLRREVGDVVTALHGFAVELAVGPLAQHRHFGIYAVAIAVAVVVVVDEGQRLFGLGGRDVLCHAEGDADFATLRVGHGRFQRAQGPIVFTYLIHFACPARAFCFVARHARGGGALARSIGQGVGDVGKTIVAPATPTVAYDPRARFILSQGVARFAIYAVAVKVELDAVVVAHDEHGVVNFRAEVADVFQTRHASSIVGRGRRYVG